MPSTNDNALLGRYMCEHDLGTKQAFGKDNLLEALGAYMGDGGLRLLARLYAMPVGVIPHAGIRSALYDLNKR